MTGGNPAAPKASGLSNNQPAYANSVIGDDQQNALGQLAQSIILDTDGTVSGSVNGKLIDVAAPKFPVDVRLATVRLFIGTTFGHDQSEWLPDALAKTELGILQRLMPVMPKSDGSALPNSPPDPEALSPELKSWASDELAVLKALMSLSNQKGSGKVGGGDVTNQLLGASMLGIPWEQVDGWQN